MSGKSLRPRGALVDYATQLWVRATGRRFGRNVPDWLRGPDAGIDGVGREFFSKYAAANQLQEQQATSPGLMLRFADLRSSAFDPDQVHPEIQRFYEVTSAYTMDAWSRWSATFAPMGRLVASMYTRRLGQLNVPLDPLDTSGGISSKVSQYSDATGKHVFSGWTRTLSDGRVVFAGAYSVATPPRLGISCVRVVFPLPNGYAACLLRPEVHSDGAMTLVQEGDAFGDAGFYFVAIDPRGHMTARYVRSMRERIAVRFDPETGLIASHDLTIWRRPYLSIRYRLRRSQSSQHPLE